MRYTAKDPDIRDVAPGELWVGVMDKPVPHIAIAIGTDDDDVVIVSRFKADEALLMGQELIRCANVISAPNN
jgi:hypothetical protein